MTRPNTTMKPCEVCGIPARADARRTSHLCSLCRRFRTSEHDALTGGEWVNDRGVMRWKPWRYSKRGAA